MEKSRQELFELFWTMPMTKFSSEVNWHSPASVEISHCAV